MSPNHSSDPKAIDEQRPTLRMDPDETVTSAPVPEPAEVTRGGDEPKLVGADDSGRGFLRGYPGEGGNPNVEPEAPGAENSGRGFLRGYPGEDAAANFGETESPGNVGAGPGERRDEEPYLHDREPTVGVGPGERESDDRDSGAGR